MSMIGNLNIVVLGAGESGVGAAILAASRGYKVFVSDYGTISNKYIDMLKAEGIPFEQGGHDYERILAADIIIKSPGIAKTTPVMQKIIEKGIRVESEIEFAGHFTDSKMICITGSNGKTTTTLLTHHLLTDAGIDAGLAGNVGKSLALQVARDPHPVYVIELSSFQLDDMMKFRADIACILNITPDHLDRYDYKMQNYIDAKFRILQNMGREQKFIYWKDDPVIDAKLSTIKLETTALPFADKKGRGVTAYVEDSRLKVTVGKYGLDIPLTSLPLPGEHNLHNTMVATTIACLMNIKPEMIEKSLASFPGVEHRLEYVCDVAGVRYVNDSKATNVDSTYYALGSMTTPTVLILGGKDKGNDYNQIKQLVVDKVKTVVAMGVDNKKIVDFFTPIVPVVDTHTLEDAIAASRAAATNGDTVLLSPCCASFDLFKSYEDRGRRFKDAVRALATRKEDV